MLAHLSVQNLRLLGLLLVDFAAREMKLRFDAGFSHKLRTVEYVSFSDALKKGDYVSLHVPLVLRGESLTPTYHLMSAEAFRRMKTTAYLINTSRGPVVDEAALYQALIRGEIAGAALDVYEQEPLPAESPLRDPAQNPTPPVRPL